MNKVNLYLGALGLALALPFGVAYAQLAPAKAPVAKLAPAANADQLKVDLKRTKIVKAASGETSAPADTAKPGDILEEIATYTNQSGGVLKQVQPRLPVPLNTELVMASVKPANAMASTDGINFSAIPLKRKVKQANGVEVETPVPLSEYRYVRWSPVELASQKSFAVSARFKVANSPAAVKTAAVSKP